MGAFANVLDSGTSSVATDPAPSFGAGGGLDWSSIGTSAANGLNTLGSLANQGLSLYGQLRNRGAGNGDPSATATAANPGLNKPAAQIPTWAVLGGLALGAVALWAIVEHG